MPLMLALAVIAGIVAARSIVAAVDAHRWDEKDRWYGPVCGVCRSPLGLATVRCRASHHRQRLANPLIMVVTPVLSGALVVSLPTYWVWPAYAVFAWTMVLLTVVDLDTELIPNRMLGPASVISGVLLVVGWVADTGAGSLLRAVAGAVGYFAAMYLLAVIARGGLGYGDVKLAGLIGLFTGFLGWQSVLAAGFGAFLVGGLVSIVLLALRIRSRKDTIPFGPFMTSTAIVAVLWSTEIAAWYSS
ncbi:MAG: A24 family peptidase [Acidimicrobiia bacterium]